MSIYYIVAKVNGEEVLYTLDSTTEVNVKYPTQITSHPVESGKLITDNSVNRNSTVSFIGHISDAKSLSGANNLTTEDYIKGILRLRSSGDYFTTYFTTKNEPWKTCLFQSIELAQNSGNNSVKSEGKRVDSWKVVLTIEQVRVKASVTEATVSSELFKDSLQKQKETSGMKTYEDKLAAVDSLEAESIANFTLAGKLVSSGVSGI